MTARGRRRRLPRAYTKHGLTPLIKAVRAAGTGVLDRRTGVWRQLSAWRAGVIEDRGGAENLSTLELDTIDQLGKLKLIADSAVEVVLSLPTIYTKRGRSLLPVALQTIHAVNIYVKAATAFGLARQAKPVPSLSEYLATRNGASAMPDVTPRSTIATTEARPVESRVEHTDGTSEEGA